MWPGKHREGGGNKPLTREWTSQPPASPRMKIGFRNISKWNKKIMKTHSCWHAMLNLSGEEVIHDQLWSQNCCFLSGTLCSDASSSSGRPSTKAHTSLLLLIGRVSFTELLEQSRVSRRNPLCETGARLWHYEASRSLHIFSVIHLTERYRICTLFY